MKHTIHTIFCKYYDELQDKYVYQSISDLMDAGIPIDEDGNELEPVDDKLYVWEDTPRGWAYVELP